MCLDAADHPTTAVEENDRWLIWGGCVRVQARRDVAVWSGDGQIFDARDGLGRSGHARGGVLGASLLRRERPQLREAERHHLIEDGSHLRMEWHVNLLALVR